MIQTQDIEYLKIPEIQTCFVQYLNGNDLLNVIQILVWYLNDVKSTGILV